MKKRLLYLLRMTTFITSAFTQNANTSVVAFPSLKMPTSSRGLAMGDCGIASAEENQQIWYNASKIAFMEHKHQASLSYAPYLAGLSNDMKFMNVNYSTNISYESSVAFGLTYLSLGNMNTKDENGATISSYQSSEFNITGAYALKLSYNSSLGVAFRFLGSQPTQFQQTNSYYGIQKKIYSVAGDFSYYKNYELDNQRKKIMFGAVISNIGPKVSLQGSDVKTFLPTNLGLGLSYSFVDYSGQHKITIASDFNKLLIPTTPQYDSTGAISAGLDPNRSLLSSMFTSFTDAPGGLKEELKEIRFSCGLEYNYIDQFCLRTGISHEDQTKGNRNFLGFGVGYKAKFSDEQSITIDFHYLVPLGYTVGISPYQNAWGLTLKFSVGRSLN